MKKLFFHKLIGGGPSLWIDQSQKLNCI